MPGPGIGPERNPGDLLAAVVRPDEVRATGVHRRGEPVVPELQRDMALFLVGRRVKGHLLHHQAVAQPVLDLLHAAGGFPTVQDGTVVAAVQVGPVIVLHVLEGGRARAVVRDFAGLAAHQGVAGVALPEGPVVGLVVEGAVVGRRRAEAVVVAAKARQGRSVMGLGRREGVLEGEAVHPQLELRGAEGDLPALGERVQESLRQLSPRLIIRVRTRIHDEVVRVVPLAPDAHEAGLEDEDHVRVLLKEGLELRHVAQRHLHRRVPGLGAFAVLVGEAQNALDASLADGVERGLDHIQIGLGDVPVHEVRQIEAHIHQRLSLGP